VRFLHVPAAVLGLLAMTLAAPDQQTANPPASIEDLVADLGHPVFAVREKAQRELWNRGDAAIPALENALQSGNPEIARRARELLDKFSWGLRPDTPPEVLKLLRQFQAGDKDPQKSTEIRKAAIQELLKLGAPGISVARALLGKNLPPEARAEVITHVATLVRREVPLRLFEGKTDEASELIALHAIGTATEGAADYAVFQVLRGNLPAAIASAEAALKAGKHTANTKLILAHLYRANGDWKKAGEVAADLPPAGDDFNLLNSLREEEGDWATLADTFPTGRANHPTALRLTLLRLAGRQKVFDDELAEVVKNAPESASPPELFEAVFALLANHRVEDATRILLEKKQNLGLLAEMLILQLRYKEALELLDTAEKFGQLLPDSERLDFDLRRGRLLMLVGKRDDAVQVFNKAAEGLMRGQGREVRSNPIMAMRSLLRAELRVGLRDLAAEHAAQFLVSGIYRTGSDSPTGESVFEILFGSNATAGETLFSLLRARKIPGDVPGPTMIRVRELLTGKASKAAVDEAVGVLRELAPRPLLATPEAATQHSHYHLALAAVCRAAGRDADADAAFKAATESIDVDVDVAGVRSWVFGVSDAYRPYVEWGDFLYDRGRYHEAAARLVDGWKRFPNQPILLFLSGKALVKAGDAKEGNRRIELSHWVSLGQERIRGRFLDELVRRGEGIAAKRETELVLRACWCHDHYFGNVMNQAARAAELIRDFDTAEKCCQRSLLVMLKTPGMYYVETSAYMVVPHSLLIYRAQAQLRAGKVEEAIALARKALAITPGHIDLITGMVTELDRLDKKAASDELFGIGWKAYQKVLAEFPDSPSTRNALATLAANCLRELDKGLDYSQAAVKADPASVGFRETLAEVHFRRGERDKAIEVMTKLAEEDSTNRLYKRQLVRYRNGALDSPKPDREDG